MPISTPPAGQSSSPLPTKGPCRPDYSSASWRASSQPSNPPMPWPSWGSEVSNRMMSWWSTSPGGGTRIYRTISIISSYQQQDPTKDAAGQKTPLHIFHGRIPRSGGYRPDHPGTRKKRGGPDRDRPALFRSPGRWPHHPGQFHPGPGKRDELPAALRAAGGHSKDRLHSPDHHGLFQPGAPIRGGGLLPKMSGSRDRWAHPPRSAPGHLPKPVQGHLRGPWADQCVLDQSPDQ